MTAIYRQRPFIDEIELNDGDKKKTIKIEISFTQDLLHRFRTLQVKIMKAQKTIDSEGPTEANCALLGECIVELFQVLFGEQNTSEILEFYGNDYIGCMADFFSYINTTIKPKLEEQAKLMKKKIKGRF